MTTSEDVTYDGATGAVIQRIVTEDHGDGTGTATTYDLTGAVTNVAPVTGLPLPGSPTGAETEAQLLERAEAARRAAYDTVMSTGPRSMARLEEADGAGSDAFRSVLRGGE